MNTANERIRTSLDSIRQAVRVLDNENKYVSIYDFDCYADNTICEQKYGLDDCDFINTNLSSGRNVTFKTYYSVPVDAQSIELEYETNVWTNEKAIIKLQ